MAFLRCGMPTMHLVRGLNKRRRIKNDPRVAAFLNLLFLGMGYNYLGKWYGFLLFQINVMMVVLLSLIMGPVLPYLMSYSISPFLSVHAWHMARKMPDT